MLRRNLPLARAAIIRAAARLAFVMAILILAIVQATPASAATPVITGISPSNGYVGTSVSLAGTIGTTNGTFQVRWEDNAGPVLKSGIASGSSVSTSFTIPTAARGTHNVILEDVSANSTATATFTVNPLITISPTSGTAGTVVTVAGTGFTASETGITITWDNVIPVASGITANAQGSWSSSFTTVPTSAAGTHTVDASGAATSAVLVPDVTFSIAASRITVNPPSGAVGSTVFVSANGFFPNETGITVTYDGTTVASGITASSEGAWTTTCTIPESASGTAHTIGAYGSQTSASTIPGQVFTVTTKISVNPTSGVVGTTVTITATGFRASENNISITYDGTSVKSGITASTAGSWSSSFTVPDSANRTHIVDASGDSTPAASVPDASFTPTPSISVSPSSGAPGTTITVTGTGFPASENNISVTFGGIPVKTGISASSKGSWSTTFAAPGAAGGSLMVGAYGSMTPAVQVPETAFAVKASVTASVASGVVGTKVNLTGSSFAVNEKGITVTYDGAVVSGNLTADANGTWSTSLTIPDSTAGKHAVSAYGSTTPQSGVSELNFMVIPDISLKPASGSVGSAVTVNGSGFEANKVLDVTYDSTSINTVPGTPTTSTRGSFSINITAPRSKGGVHKLTVTDGTNSRDSDWMMDSAPPLPPGLSSSGAGQVTGIFGDVSVTLRWPAVTDPSGIYYSLQLDTHPDFSSPSINEEGLTGTTYATGKLAMGTYYWRVKAVDGAYNESPWSASSVIKIGLIPLWIFALIIGTGLLAVAGAVLHFVRRRIPSKAAAEPEPEQSQKK